MSDRVQHDGLLVRRRRLFPVIRCVLQDASSACASRVYLTWVTALKLVPHGSNVLNLINDEQISTLVLQVYIKDRRERCE